MIKDGYHIFLLVYVDDVLITGPDESKIQEVKQFLDAAFTIKDMGPAKFFLGMEIARLAEGIYISQRKYIIDILRDTCMLDSSPVSTPLPGGLVFVSEDQDPTPLFHDPSLFRRLVGHLLYLNFTRPDLTHAVQQLSQFVHAPHVSH